MLLQTATREIELGILLLVLAAVAFVGYWVYRDAVARGMDEAPYWGAAVGTSFVIGLIVGGIVAVGVYLSRRPDTYEDADDAFEPLRDDPAEDDPHTDLPPVPELTPTRVDAASDTAIRGYARRYDDVDATGDPELLRAALREKAETGAADAPTVEEPDDVDGFEWVGDADDPAAEDAA